MNATIMMRSERGIALVISMLVLIVMSMVGLVLMSSVVLNRGTAGNDLRMRRSLNIAEAGLGEAMARIRKDQTGMLDTNPDAVCQIFNVPNGSVPALGTDSLGLATAQPVGSYLQYSTTARSPDALTIYWKKNPAGTAVMRYDGLHTPKVNDVTGLPIYVIESTGRVGNARRSLVVEAIQKPVVANAKGAMAAKVGIDYVGNAVVCGYNHRANTQYNDGDDGRDSHGGVGPADCHDNETGANDLTGAWSEGAIDLHGHSGTEGTPPTSPSQTGFYAGPWEALGMTQSEYYSWIGAPRTTLSTYNGIFYIDNNTTTMDQSANFALHSVDGEGMLYVDGDLNLNAGFHWKGLIYVEGDLHIAGQAWILGGIIVRGVGDVKPAGGMTVLYSSEAITQVLSKYGGQFVTLNWREK